jgi:uncharacterized membrane protein
MPRVIAVSLTVAALVWTALIAVLPRPAVRHSWPVVTAAAYRGAAFVCHQRPARSFHVHGLQMPVCARCSGLYAGGALGSVLGWLVARRRLHASPRAVLLVAALPTAATLVAEWGGLPVVTNAGRAVAAVPLGAAAGWVFVRLLRAEARESTSAMIG